MSLRGAIGGVVRGTLLAAVVAGAAFGALVLFAPFGAPAPQPAPASSAGALVGRIDALRLSLRGTETALEAARRQPATAGNPHDAQIAAAIERRDLALRHADAIRAALNSGTAVAALAGIRDSVVIGQLLTRRTTLDGEIAETGARLRPAHPTMRALLAQRDALATQIRQEATSIATALEGEARLDDAQIALLREAAPVPIATGDAGDAGALEARAAADRDELDRLVEAYFNSPAPAAVAPPQAEPLAPANLVLAALAGLAAIAVQVLLASRRRRRARAAADLAAWQADTDPESDAVPGAEPLRRAS